MNQMMHAAAGQNIYAQGVPQNNGGTNGGAGNPMLQMGYMGEGPSGPPNQYMLAGG